jgi:ElaB/YqjD/DUF883 family membrane-anchored ribosome-binding protein
MNDESITDKLADAAKDVADDGIHTVKGTMDTAINRTQDIVEELRDHTMEAVNQTVGRTIDRVRESLDEQRPRFEQYIASHPWIMLGGVLVLWYLLSGNRRSRA